MVKKDAPIWRDVKLTDEAKGLLYKLLADEELHWVETVVDPRMQTRIPNECFSTKSGTIGNAEYSPENKYLESPPIAATVTLGQLAGFLWGLTVPPPIPPLADGKSYDDESLYTHFGEDKELARERFMEIRRQDEEKLNNKFGDKEAQRKHLEKLQGAFDQVCSKLQCSEAVPILAEIDPEQAARDFAHIDLRQRYGIGSRYHNWALERTFSLTGCMTGDSLPVKLSELKTATQTGEKGLVDMARITLEKAMEYERLRHEAATEYLAGITDAVDMPQAEQVKVKSMQSGRGGIGREGNV